jgi:uncharacterized membrane protein
MLKLAHTPFRHSRQLAVIASLVLATFVACGLLGLRWAYTQRGTYSWLLWNLFLAWLPLFSALVAYNLDKSRLRLKWLMVICCALIWLLFFPNAPYLVTDLIHLKPKPEAPFWFDLILLVAFAWTGCLLGFVSLSLMQEVVRKAVGRVAGWLFAAAVLVLSSFGIYLGRFLRLNSWDALSNPLRILADISAPILHPRSHVQSLAFSLLFAVFFAAMYLTLTALTHFRHETQQT